VLQAIAVLSVKVDALRDELATHHSIDMAELDQLRVRLDALQARPFPNYSGRVFGMPVTLRPEGVQR
jgi:hypothetical protein